MQVCAPSFRACTIHQDMSILLLPPIQAPGVVARGIPLIGVRRMRLLSGVWLTMHAGNWVHAVIVTNRINYSLA